MLPAVIALIGSLALACTSEPPLTLPPLGSHQVQIGEAWQLQLQAQGAVPPLKWRVIEGPAEVFALANSPAGLLTWTPSVFDLAPTKPGQPRAPGPLHQMGVEVRDAAGQTAQAFGTLQARPAQPR